MGKNRTVNTHVSSLDSLMIDTVATYVFPLNTYFLSYFEVKLWTS